MFREGLADSLAKDPNLKVVGQCSSAAEALPLLKSGQPTLILLDVDLGATRGLAFVEAVRQKGFAGQILIVTAGISDQEAVPSYQFMTSPPPSNTSRHSATNPGMCSARGSWLGNCDSIRCAFMRSRAPVGTPSNA